MIPSFQRIIFLHGVGGTGQAMHQLAEAIGPSRAALFPDGPQPFDMGAGRQWFSVRGVTEANRPARIAAAMPGFVGLIEGLGDPRGSLLIGFSQGAIMALHAVAAGLGAAGVIAVAGRLAGPVPARRDWPHISLMHGAEDPVMSVEVARSTLSWLRDAGAAPRLTVFSGLGHAIDGRVIAAVRESLIASHAREISQGG